MSAMSYKRPLVTERLEGHFYAVPKDRNSVVKIEIWRREIPVTQEFGPNTDWEHVGTSIQRFYKTEKGRDVIKQGDHFLVPALGNLSVYQLTDEEARKAGLY